MEIKLPEGHGDRDEAIEAILRQEIADAQAELPAIREIFQRYLMSARGYSEADIEADVHFVISLAGETHQSSADLILSAGGKRTVLVKCFAGALVSRERHALACARLAEKNYQIPYTIVTDGGAATLLDTATGRTLGEGLAAIPSRVQLEDWVQRARYAPLPQERLEKEQRILLAFDTIKCSFPAEE